MTLYFAVSAVSAFFGAGAFALLFHAPLRTILPSCLIAALGYLLYVVLDAAGNGTVACYFLGGLVMSALCELAARRMKTPATVFLTSSLVTLVPGFDLFQIMLYLAQVDGALAASHAMTALQGVMAIAAATAACTVVFRAVKPHARHTA